MSTTSTFGSSNEDEGQDDWFVYSQPTVLTLQSAAAHQIARIIFHGYISQSKFHDSGTGWLLRDVRLDDQNCEEDLRNLIRTLGTPDLIESILFNSLVDVRDAMVHWIEHLRSDVFGNNPLDKYGLAGFNLEWCVWLANGEIDYEKSALEMLARDEVSDVQKFALISRYCMEDKIGTVSLDSIPEQVKEVDFYGDVLLYYWIRYKKQELYTLSVPDDWVMPMSIGAAISVGICTSHGTAFEYFWHRLSGDERVFAIKLWLRSCAHPRSWSIIERLFSTLNIYQQRSVLAETVDHFLLLSASMSRSLESAAWTWTRYKNTITKRQFAHVLCKLFRAVIGVEEKMRFLIYIWDTANDELKQGVLDENVGLIISSLCGESRCCGAALEFCNCLLEQLPLGSRVQVIERCTESFSGLRRNEDLRSLDKVLNLPTCLACVIGPVAMKATWVRSHHVQSLCSALLAQGKFDLFYRNLEWCFEQDVEAARSFKMKLLGVKDAWNGSRLYFYLTVPLVAETENWTRLKTLVYEIFPNHDRLRMGILQRLLLSFAEGCQYQIELRRNIDVLQKVVEDTFHNEDLARAKESFAKSFGASLKRREYWRHEGECDESFLVNFASWCVGDDVDAMAKFKKVVSHCDIFERMFYALSKAYLSSNELKMMLLERLDGYLTWYLGTKEAVREYKVCRVNEFRGELEIFLKTQKVDDERSLEMLSRWMCGDDEEAIGKLRLMVARYKKS